MNPELKAKWIAALRSGEYEQARGCLRDPKANGYCCLGVLCDVSGFGRWNDEGTGFLLDGVTHLDGDLDYVAYGKLVTAFDLPSDFECELVVMNDAEDFTLPEIAERIEQRTDI